MIHFFEVSLVPSWGEAECISLSMQGIKHSILICLLCFLSLSLLRTTYLTPTTSVTAAKQISFVPARDGEGIEQETKQLRQWWSPWLQPQSPLLRGLRVEPGPLLHSIVQLFRLRSQKAFAIYWRKGFVIVRDHFTVFIFFSWSFHPSFREQPSHDIHSFIHSVHIYSVLNMCRALC